MTQPLAKGPTYRTVKGTKRAVEAIVICDQCGNRKIGWVWAAANHRLDGKIDPDCPTVHVFDGEAKPPFDLGKPEERGDFTWVDGGLELEAFRAMKERPGRLEYKGHTDYTLKTDDVLTAYCHPPRRRDARRRAARDPRSEEGAASACLRPTDRVAFR